MKYQGESARPERTASAAGEAAQETSPTGGVGPVIVRHSSRWAWSRALGEYDWMDSHAPSFDLYGYW
jgi:hypothetical protein